MYILIHFLKPKSFLSDLIPDNFIDIHSHLLPGIDDGATTIDDTLLLMTQMKSFGFENFITTPHIITNVWNNNEQSIPLKFNETNKLLENKIAIHSFGYAAEYMMDSFFMEKIEKQQLLTFKEKHILVEISYLSPPLQLYDIIFELQLSGYKPIFAHPERYLFYHNNFSEYEKLKKAGCLFQLNLLSSVGYYGSNVAKIAGLLLEKGYIDFVGSDVHHQNHINAFNQKVTLKNLKSLEEVISNNLFFLK